MKRSKKLKRKLETRIREWEQGVGQKQPKAYRRPGSNQ